jgi:hypothetical protein
MPLRALITTVARPLIVWISLLLLTTAKAAAWDWPPCRCEPVRHLQLPAPVVRPYPICFYSERPSEDKLAELRKGLIRVVRAYLGKKAQVTFSPDSRWVIARGWRSGHSSLEKIWPRLGCIGEYRSGISYPYYSHCLDLLRETLRTHSYLKRGDKSDFLKGFLGYCNGSSIAEPATAPEAPSGETH